MNNVRCSGSGLVSFGRKARRKYCPTVRSVFRSLPALLLGLAAFGCAARTPVEAPSVVLDPLPKVEPLPYRLAAGDLLSIKFWGNPELDQAVRIRPDGGISLPFVDEVPAAGLTPAELDAELTRRYTGELARPEITVIVDEFAGQRVFVGGEVEEQGPVSLEGNMSLLQAVHEAGGFLTSARRKQVLLIRTLHDGRRIARSIDVRSVLSGADPGADVSLQPSDIIFVPRTKITNVTLFVDQYVYGVLGIRPILTIPLIGEDSLFGGDDTPAPEPAPDAGEGSGNGR